MVNCKGFAPSLCNGSILLNTLLKEHFIIQGNFSLILSFKSFVLCDKFSTLCIPIKAYEFIIDCKNYVI